MKLDFKYNDRYYDQAYRDDDDDYRRDPDFYFENRSDALHFRKYILEIMEDDDDEISDDLYDAIDPDNLTINGLYKSN